MMIRGRYSCASHNVAATCNNNPALLNINQRSCHRQAASFRRHRREWPNKTLRDTSNPLPIGLRDVRWVRWSDGWWARNANGPVHVLPDPRLGIGRWLRGDGYPCGQPMQLTTTATSNLITERLERDLAHIFSCPKNDLDESLALGAPSHSLEMLQTIVAAAFCEPLGDELKGYLGRLGWNSDDNDIDRIWSRWPRRSNFVEPIVEINSRGVRHVHLTSPLTFLKSESDERIDDEIRWGFLNLKSFSHLCQGGEVYKNHNLQIFADARTINLCG